MPEIFSSTPASSTRTSSPTPVDPGVPAADPALPTVEAVVTRLTAADRHAKHVDEYSQFMRSQQPSRNPFASFAAKPIGVAFEAQHAEEQVLLLLRQSLITQIKYVLIAIGLFLLPALFDYVGLLNFLPEKFQLVATVGWYSMIVAYVLEVFLTWFYNVYIVTDERVIDVDFNSLLFKNVAYAKLDNIEDISATTTGALGAIFDYGTVKIQTAGASTDLFEFENVPHPSKVVAFLNEMLIEEEQEKLDRRAI